MSTADHNVPPTPDRVVKLADLAPAPSTYTMSDAERHQIEHEIAHYPEARAASIEALKIVQKAHGWVPDGAIPAIAQLLGISAADVEGVATFYNMIYRQPVGRHVIKICDNISCYLTGYEDVAKAFSDKLGLVYGQTTPDQRFTLLPVSCLGACDHGPVLMIDEDTHRDVSPDAVAAILERYA